MACLDPREKQKCHEISGRFVGGPERAPTPLKAILFQYGTAHGCQQHLNVQKKFFLLHFVWMLHLQQWSREEIKLLNNRVLNIAGTNNRIRERIKSYPLGFGTFGGSQLLTHSPNKLRSGMSRCWPSEGGLRSAQQPQLLRWFQPIPSLSSVSRGHASSQAWGSCSMSGTASVQGRELDTEDTTRNTHKVRLLRCLCWWTHFHQSCVGGKHSQTVSPVGEEGFKPWARKLMDPRGYRVKRPKAYTTWAHRPGRNYNLPKCWWSICSVDTKVPIASLWVSLRLPRPVWLCKKMKIGKKMVISVSIVDWVHNFKGTKQTEKCPVSNVKISLSPSSLGKLFHG